MRGKNSTIGLGILTAIASSLCCIVPLIAIIAGTSSLATNFSWIEPARPYLLGVTILALGFAWYQQLKPVTADDCGCELTKVSFFQTKRFLSIVTVFAILMMAFPYYSGSLLGRNLPDKAMLENIETEDLIAYEFELEGMTCGGCEKHVTDAVYNLEGVLEVSTSYENGKTIVKFDDSKTTTEAIKNAITTTGYKVKGMKKINSKTASRNSNIE